MIRKMEYYTVGQMADLCHLTTEQLRHYDKNNIFKPEVRDDTTGYRYYSNKQIEDILMIKELKRTGLPLKSIGALVRNKELLLIKNLLEDNRYVLKQQVEEIHQRYDLLIDVLLRVTNALNVINEQYLINMSKPVDKAFKIVDIPKRRVAFTRYQGSYSGNASFLYRYAELLNIVDENHLATSSLITAVFHESFSKQFASQTEDTMGDLEVFADILSGNSDCANCREFGGFKAAVTTYVGHYRDMENTHEELSKWATEEGWKVSGISFHEFVIGRTMTDNEDRYITKIYMPLEVTEI